MHRGVARGGLQGFWKKSIGTFLSKFRETTFSFFEEEQKKSNLKRHHKLYRRLQYYKVHKLAGSCDHATTTPRKANIESTISWKFVLRIKETQFLKTRNSKLSLGSMPLDPLSKERLRRSIVNRASHIHK